jgi:hypothetical protein
MPDPWWAAVPGVAAVCARHGGGTLPEVIGRLAAEGDPIAELTVLRELLAAAREEQQLAAGLASTVECPFCGAEPGRLCTRVRGRFAGQVLGSLGERLASPFRAAQHHRARFTAAVDAGLRAVTEP